jgi:hypothetical protein
MTHLSEPSHYPNPRHILKRLRFRYGKLRELFLRASTQKRQIPHIFRAMWSFKNQHLGDGRSPSVEVCSPDK